MEETTISTTAGLIAMAKGTAIGAILGSIGSFVCGSVGYMTGSKAGNIKKPDI